MIHHSDAGSQYTSFKLAEHLGAVGIAASIGSVGDAYDNALMESTVGLFKTELIKPHRPWKTLSQVELTTAEWVDWYNHRRLHGEIGLPPVEHEAHYYTEPAKPPGHNHSLRSLGDRAASPAGRSSGSGTRARRDERPTRSAALSLPPNARAPQSHAPGDLSPACAAAATAGHGRPAYRAASTVGRELRFCDADLRHERAVCVKARSPVAHPWWMWNRADSAWPWHAGHI
ncbi:integrase core domain-containing protein [Streptomyces sp. NPDC006172]|uniref:integrase core domain-containing protein n=1 Tax=Streptomyces sp. NPDC006172 TaxID=3154470 RepID=UPI0033EFDD73